MSHMALFEQLTPPHQPIDSDFVLPLRDLVL
jgi:hypothetical protein